MGNRAAPLVSVLVSTYNAERFLPGCLQDLEQQSIADRIEIVVIDSGSSENEAAIATSFAKQFGNVIYERTDERETIYAAWNRGLARARGTYVTNANTDDRTRRDAYEILSSRLEERPDVALVYADSAITEVPNEPFESAPVVGVFRWPEFSIDALFGEACVGPHPMWRRSLHERYGLFDDEFEVAGDYEWWLRIAQSETLLHVPEVLGLYYMSEDTLGRRNPELTNAEVERARERHWPIEQGPLPAYGVDYIDAVGVLGQQRQRRLRELRQWITELEEAREWHQQQAVSWRELADEREQLLDEERSRHSQTTAGAARASNEAAGVSSEADALGAQVEELSALLYAIEHSRAYRIGLAARRAKLTADRVTKLGRRLTRVTRKRARRRQAIASSRRHTGPTVSVVMPVYNKGRVLLESVASVRSQTLASWELIVWNDGSTDAATIEALRELEGLMGVNVVDAENRGVIGARNAALAEARGEFICCLDADDLISPTYFEKAVLFLDEHPDVAIVYPWMRCFGDASFEWRAPDLDPKLIAQENAVPVAAVMRRAVIDLTGGFNPAMAEGVEDWELWAHAADLGFRGRVIPEHLFLYRYSSTEGRDASARDVYEDLRYRINQLHPELASAPDKPPVRGAMEPSVRIERGSFLLPRGTGRPVVFFVPWLTRGGGGERFVNDVARGLVADGRTVVIVATLGCPDGMTDATEQTLQITPYVYDLTRFLQPETWLDFCGSLIWRLGAPVLINVGSTWFYDNLGALRQSGRGRVAVVDQLFNEIGHVANSVAAGRNIDLTVTAYRALERLLVENHRVPSRVVTVPIGIEPSSNGATPRPKRTRPVVGWIGRLSVEKRPEWFVQMAAVLGELANFRLAGEGPRLSEVRRVSENVSSLELSGFVDDALEFIADCDLIVITSEIEGIPLVAMEAIAAGTPVVAAEVGGLADLIEPGVNGYLVSPERPDELVAQVRSLLEQPNELRRLQDAVAKAGLPERFKTPAMMERFRELLV